MTRIGATLAAVRDEAGYTLAELSERTCIRPAVLAAMEDDEFGACGGDFYARGHIRSVCRELGIDAEPLVERFDRDHAKPRPRTPFKAQAVVPPGGSRPSAPEDPGGGPDPGEEEVRRVASERPHQIGWGVPAPRDAQRPPAPRREAGRDAAAPAAGPAGAAPAAEGGEAWPEYAEYDDWPEVDQPEEAAAEAAVPDPDAVPVDAAPDHPVPGEPAPVEPVPVEPEPAVAPAPPAPAAAA
ncbi:helix-turn-helix domain-containing protein, partial [Nocardiopsis trehalosi]|uniref:helix-turn-helix domain-containing protein n=1 Tax=Nocardiopsis trehalosi TaxID=109329 RepID=UPI001C3F39ED